MKKTKGGSKRATKKIITNVRYDIYAIALCAIGGVIAVIVLSHSAGLLGGFGDLGLQYAFGKGRFILPWFFIIWGIGLARGAQFKLATTIGVLISFASLISILALSSPPEKYLDIPSAKEFGGFLGGLSSLVTTKLLGVTASYIIFIAALLIGILLVIDKPIKEIVSAVSMLFKGSNMRNKKDMSAIEKTLPLDNKKVNIGHHSTTVLPGTQQGEDLGGQGETVLIEEKDIRTKSPDSKAEIEGYSLPPIELLRQSSAISKADKKDIAHQVEAIERTLSSFDVDARVTNVMQGPTVTLHEIHLGSGVKVNRISNLEPDLALALATPDIRILAPIPGKSAVGIEVPNNRRELVTLGDILRSPVSEKFRDNPLATGLGKDISGKPVFADIARMPHLLIAGATGSGKSVAINCLIITILMKALPEKVKFIMIDPKLVELSIYNGIPHLLAPVVSDPKKASSALSWVVAEMEERYQRLYGAGAKAIDAYNALVVKKPETGSHMPYILVIIDELADLMMTSASDVEAAICRIAQMARAVGIHLIVATQRPSVNVITGLIKANITSRIAFAVSTQHDSRVIIDSVGADKLVGRGDMLFMSPTTMKPERLQGTYISEPEIQAVVDHVKKQAPQPEYVHEILTMPTRTNMDNIEISDPLWEDAIEIVFSTGQASVSMLQRRLGIGYTRAGRLMDILEEKRIVGPYEGSKPRALLISRGDWERMKSGSQDTET